MSNGSLRISTGWDKVPPEYIPYLSFLLGFDMPYFPQSLDSLRRTMLRNTVRLQQLKGSRRVLIELFEIFGFAILISNLWWSKDGERLIRPGQDLPPDFADQEIDVEQKCQMEPLFSNYSTDGFGELSIPLLHRPQKGEVESEFVSELGVPDITVDAWLVDAGSTAHADLQAISDAMDADPSGYGESVSCILPAVSSSGVQGYSKVVVSGDTGLGQSETLSGKSPPFTKSGVKFNKDANTLDTVFNGAISFTAPNAINASTQELVLFAFVKYDKLKIIVPASLKDLQSNRFDVQLLTRKSEQIGPDVIEFVIDFLFRLKAFHSLLNVIRFRIDLNESYEVTDFCVGGDVTQRFDTDGGRLQVPPAIIPETTDPCDRTPEKIGYKPEDIELRDIKLESLPEAA